MAHIIRADLGFYSVVRYGLERHRNDVGRPLEIPDDAWDEMLGESEKIVRERLNGSFANLMAYHQKIHQKVLGEFADIREEELEAPSMYWEGYPMSLRFRLHRFDAHLRQHTIQIDKTLLALGHSPTEAKRLGRLILSALSEVDGARIGAPDVGLDVLNEAARLIKTWTAEIQSALDH